MLEPLKFYNGKPPDPILGGQATMLPNMFGQTTCSEDATVNKNDTRLRIFSGTANPALAQVKLQFHKAACKYPSTDCFFILWHLIASI